jgi:hypothetical protein
MGFLRQKELISGFLELKYFKNSQSPQMSQVLQNVIPITFSRFK